MIWHNDFKVGWKSRRNLVRLVERRLRRKAKQLVVRGSSFDGKGRGSSRKLNFHHDGKREKEEGVEGPFATSASNVPGLTVMLPPSRPVLHEWRENDSSTLLLSSSGFPCKVFF